MTVSENPSPLTGQGGLITSYPVNALTDITSTRTTGTSKETGEPVSSKKTLQQRFQNLTGGITKNLGQCFQCLIQPNRIDDNGIQLSKIESDLANLINENIVTNIV